MRDIAHMDLKGSRIDGSLHGIQARWEALLAEGIARLQAGNAEAAVALLSEAVQESARYHPLFHFFESGLNLELGILMLRAEKGHNAVPYFERAIFLDHNNETAKQGLAAAQTKDFDACLTPYPFAALTEDLPAAVSGTGMHALRRQARKETAQKAATLYAQAIATCEATHQAYHRAAALPWLWRARAFHQLGQIALARNDARRGLDLDATNPDLMGLSALNAN